MKLAEVRRRLLEDVEKLKSPDGYLNAGLPRYNTLFGRDSLISAWQMLDIDPSIARATLQTLAKHQGKMVKPRAEEEPGKILHEHRFQPESQAELPYWDFPYYGSVDSTPLFLFLAGEYFRKTGDKRFLLKIWPNIVASYRWIKDYGDRDKDGYVEYERKTPHGLFHQGWKDSSTDHLKVEPPVAIVEAQGYVFAAYRNLVFLDTELRKGVFLVEACQAAEDLKKKFNEEFWVEENNCFALALDGKKRQIKSVTSNPGHLLFTGIVAQEKKASLVNRLFKPDLWTAYGLRTHSSEEPDFDPHSYHKGSVWPHDNWITYKGLLNLGFSAHASRIKEALLRAYNALGNIPELYVVVDDTIALPSQQKGVRANSLQAWCSAGLLEMIWRD